jgi:signal transduction histidine kinase
MAFCQPPQQDTVTVRYRGRIGSLDCRLAARFWRLCLVFAIATAVATIAEAASPETKRILILNSFGHDFRPWTEYERIIREQFTRQSPWPLDIHEYPLVTSHSGEEYPEAPFVEYLKAIEAVHPSDLVVCIGTQASNFVQQNRSRLFTATPTIRTMVEQRRVRSDGLTAKDAVVSIVLDFAASFADMLRVLPGTRQIVVINGTSPNEKFWLGEMKQAAKPLEGRVAFQWFEDTPFEEIVRQSRSFPQGTAIYFFLMNVDAAGIVHENDTALKRLYEAANAPIFSNDDGYFGQEIVGGPMQSMLEIGRTTAAVGIRILGGEKAGAIKMSPIEYVAPRYDWRLLQRWGIAEKLLPPGSLVQFREPSAWERFRWQILLITAIVLLQAALIASLLHQRRLRRVAEVNARQRMAELAHVNRYSMAGELTTSIAHELNQPLGSILVNTETAAAMLEAPALDVGELKEILSDIRRDDQRAGEVLRRLRSLLKRAPFEAADVDLGRVVTESLDLVSGLTHARGVTIENLPSTEALHVRGDRIQLQQVLLNLFVNASDAMAHLDKSQRMVVVRTARDGDFAEIEVADHGPGILGGKLEEVFEPFYTSKFNGMGMGLSIARTIVEAHNGKISAENRAGQGALFRIRLPLARSSALVAS